jgi:A/G-specific adenine glycosylase
VAALGGFPESEEDLRKLPGLGAYSAAAVAAIAFGKRAVVVDANVERVVARLFLIAEPLPGAKPAIRAAADAITPDEAAGDFAQAMMDLGATICVPRDPKCPLCPLQEHCLAFKSGNPAALPVKAPKKAKPQRTGTAWWIERGGKVWLVRRPPSGMLGGMRALPDDGWTARRDGSGEPPLPGEWKDAGAVSHTFTHAQLTLRLRVLEDASQPHGEGEWWPIERLEEAGLPTVFAKAARMALQSFSR